MTNNQRFILAMTGIITAGLCFMRATEAGPRTPRVIRAEAFEVVDTNGKTRIRLSVKKRVINNVAYDVSWVELFSGDKQGVVLAHEAKTGTAIVAVSSESGSKSAGAALAAFSESGMAPFLKDTKFVSQTKAQLSSQLFGTPTGQKTFVMTTASTSGDATTMVFGKNARTLMVGREANMILMEGDKNDRKVRYVSADDMQTASGAEVSEALNQAQKELQSGKP